MSITFHPDHPDAFKEATCARCAEFCVDAEARWDCECDCHFEYMAPSVNMSNTNAAQVLIALGYEAMNYGALDASDLLARCTMGSATVNTAVGVDDSGIAPVRDGNFIECGLRPGYFDARFRSLAEVAAWAAERDVAVSFA